MASTECLDRLSTVHVGRIGISIDALPIILPVNFAFLDDGVFFRTGGGTKMDAATSGAIVAFQADAYAPDGSAGWSVLIIGKCNQVTDEVALDRADSVLAAKWSLVGEVGNVVRVNLTQVTGRRFGDTSNPWLLLH